ncbi:hypothetical protein LPAF129_04010 [Ligilactobacillus pabuli]|uniref:Uncharacterized protein n=1 Tax=Ligilactobacillus pabuli TaxID=2886039 RepID=A0ABQ5JFV1_9LACO|nr:hypothetical protein [Ligilactobacillus pabuli]GKS80716.1 hypothetical protein LPAF129_04010 [Ligilactobacillus pabuli]
MKVYVLEMVSEGGSIVYGVYKTRKSAELVGLSQVGKSWPNYYITEQEIHGEGKQITECEYCSQEYNIEGDYTELELNLPDRKIIAWGDGEAVLKNVNYCPMCGRRLTDE